MSLGYQNEGPDFERLDKMMVFQNALASFNQSNVSSKTSRKILAQLIRLVYVGESFSEEDATQLFFTITKLFQKDNAGLRQMTYVAIKELRAFTDNVIMGTSVIMKDVQSAQGQIYRPNAIRALGSIIDPGSVESIDRLVRAAIVDRNGSVSSAALLAAYHLLPVAKDAVRRWSAEVSEAVMSPKLYQLHDEHSGAHMQGTSESFTQYHALGLIHELRTHDRVASLKMVQQLASSSLSSPQAIVLLIRYILRYIEEDNKLHNQLFPFLRGWLQHRSDIVNIEAARSILRLKTASAADHQATILVLQSFLGSPRTCTRFAAIRILCEFAAVSPELVSTANSEIESLIGDSNRSISTFAVTTLLKTGSESSVDKLIDQISDFMDGNVADAFKMTVVNAIRQLAVKFTSKHDAMLKFFERELHSESGLALKTCVVDAYFDIIKSNPLVLDIALEHLCEFIEDSDYTELSVRILHLLGTMGPQAPDPSLYVRYIYNRVVLENSLIRGAAVAALSKFALVDNDEKLKHSVQVLLKRCLQDHTDEVRDRAAQSLGLLQLPEASNLLNPKYKFELGKLESALVQYIHDPANLANSFEAVSVPRTSEDQRRAERTAQVNKMFDSSAELAAKKAKITKEEPPQSQEQAAAGYRSALGQISQFAAFGKLLHSSAEPLQLTESEMEYVVEQITHVYDEHIVLQFNVHNTFELELADVHAEIDYEDADIELEEQLQLPINKLAPNTRGTIYVAINKPQSIVVAKMPCRLRYQIKESEDDEGQEDEYGIQDVEIWPGDFVVPQFIENFDAKFSQLEDEETVTRQLSVTSIQSAVSLLTAKLGMMPAENTGTAESESSHTLKLYGVCIDQFEIAATARIVRSAKTGVVAKISVRTSDEYAEVIASAL